MQIDINDKQARETLDAPILSTQRNFLYISSTVFFIILICIPGSIYVATRMSHPQKGHIAQHATLQKQIQPTILPSVIPSVSLEPTNPEIFSNNTLDCGTLVYDLAKLEENYSSPGPPPIKSPAIDCLANASLTCKPATLVTTQLYDDIGYEGSGVSEQDMQEFDIRQTKTGSCELYEKMVKVNFTHVPSTSPQPTVNYPLQDISPQGLTLLKNQKEGKDSYCLYTNYQTLSQTISDWENSEPFIIGGGKDCSDYNPNATPIPPFGG